MSYDTAGINYELGLESCILPHGMDWQATNVQTSLLCCMEVETTYTDQLNMTHKYTLAALVHRESRNPSFVPSLPQLPHFLNFRSKHL
jgi:hypothetical protein